MRIRAFSTFLAALMLAAGPATVTEAQDQPAATTQVRGVLLDAEGLPASGYQLGLKSGAGDLYLAPPTGPDGSFALDGVPVDTYKVVAFSPDGAEFPVVGGEINLQAGRIQRVELRLQAPAHAPGRPPISPAAPTIKGGGGWLSRVWHSGGGGKAGLIALFGGGAVGLTQLLDDNEKTVSNPVP